MITTDNVKDNAALSSLTDEQIAAVVELSNNSETAAVDSKAADIERGFIAAIAEKSNATVKDGENASAFMARVITESADKIATITKERDTNEKEVARLNKVIAEGSNSEELQKKYEQSQKDFKALTKEYGALQSTIAEKDAKHAKEINSLKMDVIFDGAKNGIKYKDGIAVAAVDALTRQAIEKVKTMNPEFVDNGEGGKALVFKNADGSIMRNKDNNLNYSTAGELLLAELKTYGIIAEDEQKGAGSQPPKGSDNVSIAGARTRTEAYDIIKKTLNARGLVAGTAEFQAEMDKMYKDNGVDKLPFN